jgi:hypothetical protein
VSYFSDNYSRLTFPLADGEKPGFREAQRGALFAIGSHFSGRSDPGVITMPTGAGQCVFAPGQSWKTKVIGVMRSKC